MPPKPNSITASTTATAAIPDPMTLISPGRPSSPNLTARKGVTESRGLTYELKGEPSLSGLSRG